MIFHIKKFFIFFKNFCPITKTKFINFVKFIFIFFKFIYLNRFFRSNYKGSS